jgi:hypothetical protein
VVRVSGRTGRPPFRSPYALWPVRLFADAGVLARFSELRFCRRPFGIRLFGALVGLSFPQIESFRLTGCVGKEPSTTVRKYT